ncbi:WecB/TagA/CpsF family glycosyltransferase [Oceaniovalibus sp. ACAM 378]|uniref:WecB/TagA/CpsF family glycosyltransferase n=1 Tax=Oceaniovalibus sp. ACAM 378 TaxID=2599923 RepID=UPI0011D6B99B|nr:WecB/TagA/CpsF family glycosyltransferase [Oceaniovalibus sp. ACAM 378]TYB89843.1 WecB/TagA/CpsF family glycosyltransferase [Oceaniovalibus sp. ACAM 378]
MHFVFGRRRITINMPTRAGLMQTIRQRFVSGRGFALATINLDHIVKMRASTAFTDAYCSQDLVVADGRPIVWLSRLAGQPVELMPGSDMIVPLCELAVETGVSVAMIGSKQEALDLATRALMARVPGLNMVMRHAPSGVFDPSGAEAAAILADLDASGAQLCFLALGAPKQEQLAARGRREVPRVGFVSIGAGLDFLSGHQVRAPRWMRAVALEWLWRTIQEPRRMVPRYAASAAILPGQVLAALRLRRR